MSAELHRTDADARGARRILCKQIDEAVAALDGKRVADSKIHEARKAIKKARATLRLMRDAIPATSYKRENAALRDAARPLSAIRDARVLIDTLDRLEQLYGPAAKQSIPAGFRRDLVRAQDEIRESVTGARGALPGSVKALLAARRRVMRLRVTAAGWRDIGKGLKRVYRKGRNAMKQARKTPTAECLHEWRKQTKYLWHQLQTLEPMWPGPIGELADQTHKLSDYLGDDHDLVVLRENVMAHPKSFTGPGGSGALLALIDRCQKQLREKAFLAGGRIYDEKPAAFEGRAGRYWRRWQNEKAEYAPRRPAARVRVH